MHPSVQTVTILTRDFTAAAFPGFWLALSFPGWKMLPCIELVFLPHSSFFGQVVITLTATTQRTGGAVL